MIPLDEIITSNFEQISGVYVPQPYIQQQVEAPRIQVEIEIPSKYSNPTHLYFVINQRKKLVECIDIEVEPEVRGRGIGRALVLSMESAAKLYQCTQSRVLIALNEPFWSRLGYQLIPNRSAKKLLN